MGSKQKTSGLFLDCKLGGVFSVIDPAQVAPDGGSLFEYGFGWKWCLFKG